MLSPVLSKKSDVAIFNLSFCPRKNNIFNEIETGDLSGNIKWVQINNDQWTKEDLKKSINLMKEIWKDKFDKKCDYISFYLPYSRFHKTPTKLVLDDTENNRIGIITEVIYNLNIVLKFMKSKNVYNNEIFTDFEKIIEEHEARKNRTSRIYKFFDELIDIYIFENNSKLSVAIYSLSTYADLHIYCIFALGGYIKNIIFEQRGIIRFFDTSKFYFLQTTDNTCLRYRIIFSIFYIVKYSFKLVISDIDDIQCIFVSFVSNENSMLNWNYNEKEKKIMNTPIIKTFAPLSTLIINFSLDVLTLVEYNKEIMLKLLTNAYAYEMKSNNEINFVFPNARRITSECGDLSAVIRGNINAYSVPNVFSKESNIIENYLYSWIQEMCPSDTFTETEKIIINKLAEKKSTKKNQIPDVNYMVTKDDEDDVFIFLDLYAKTIKYLRKQNE